MSPKSKSANTTNYSSSDSEHEEEPIPVNHNFRCRGKKAPAPSTSVPEGLEDLLVIDSGGDLAEAIEATPTSSDGTDVNEKSKEGEPRKKISELEGAMNKTMSKVVEKALEKALIKPGLEKSLGSIAVTKSLRAQKRDRKAEREKTTGTKWFDMPATELTEEKRADLELLQMRAVLDPSRHYRKSDRNVLPKYFQVGHVVDSPEDFYSGRLTKRERKRTMLDEVMIDTEVTEKSKKKYSEIIDHERSKRRGAFQKSGYQNKKKKTK